MNSGSSCRMFVRDVKSVCARCCAMRQPPNDLNYATSKKNEFLDTWQFSWYQEFIIPWSKLPFPWGPPLWVLLPREVP